MLEDFLSEQSLINSKFEKFMESSENNFGKSISSESDNVNNQNINLITEENSQHNVSQTLIKWTENSDYNKLTRLIPIYKPDQNISTFLQLFKEMTVTMMDPALKRLILLSKLADIPRQFF